MIVRRELPEDVSAVNEVQAEAFRRVAGAEPYEVRVLDGLRSCGGWIPRFSLVAELDGEVVGHVVCTRAHVESWPVLGLGPIAVRPDHQRAGVGSALMHAMVGAADAVDEPLIALLGSPVYYARFGFVGSTQYAIEAPEADWGAHFQVRTMSGFRGGIRGKFAYAAPFVDVV
jgi:putative acetyltransferase